MMLTLVEKLRSRAWEHRNHRVLREAAAAEILEVTEDRDSLTRDLVKALAYAADLKCQLVRQRGDVIEEVVAVVEKGLMHYSKDLVKTIRGMK